MDINSQETEFTVRDAKSTDAAELARLRWENRANDHVGRAFPEFARACEDWLRRALGSGRWVIGVASAHDDSLCACMFLQRVDKVPIPGSIERA